MKAMKKIAEDNRRFCLSKLRDSRCSHLLLLLGWVGYLILFFLTESMIPAEQCYSVHCAIDDWIPFWEVFWIPYVFWYALIALSLGYFLLRNVDSFKRLQTYIMITQAVAIIVYVVLPTRQDLRPEAFPRDNFLTQCVEFLYQIDTNTGVCPSLHVAISLGILSVWSKEKGISRWWKAFVAMAVVLICLSTMFIKQHSAVDFFAAIPVCLLAEGIVYRDRLPKPRNRKN